MTARCLSAATILAGLAAVAACPFACAFLARRPPASALRGSAATTLTMAKKRIGTAGKFNKQKDLEAKMAAARRQREATEGGETVNEGEGAVEEAPLSAEEIKLRNDQRRFAEVSVGNDLPSVTPWRRRRRLFFMRGSSAARRLSDVAAALTPVSRTQ